MATALTHAVAVPSYNFIAALCHLHRFLAHLSMRECLSAAVRMSRRALQVLLILLLGLSSVCVQPEDAVHLWLGRGPTKHLRSRDRFISVLQR